MFGTSNPRRLVTATYPGPLWRAFWVAPVGHQNAFLDASFLQVQEDLSVITGTSSFTLGGYAQGSKCMLRMVTHFGHRREYRSGQSHQLFAAPHAGHTERSSRYWRGPKCL